METVLKGLNVSFKANFLTASLEKSIDGVHDTA
jgi:hypothetical protein